VGGLSWLPTTFERRRILALFRGATQGKTPWKNGSHSKAGFYQLALSHRKFSFLQSFSFIQQAKQFGNRCSSQTHLDYQLNMLA
jgi:hypothetical protein